MKDVLIQLQMALMTNLRTVWMDDEDLDYTALQSTSDDCRVNAGVCLGQLSQRLSDMAKAQAMYPANMTVYGNHPTLMPPMSPSLQYSSSRSTASSTFSRAVPPRTPDSIADHMSHLSMASTIRPSHFERKPSGAGSSQGSQGSFAKWGSPRAEVPPVPVIPEQYPTLQQPDSDNQSLHSLRRPSSHTLAPEDVELLSPTTFQADKSSSQPASPPLPGAQDLDRESYISYGAESQAATSPGMSRNSSTHLSATASEPLQGRREELIPSRMNGAANDIRFQTVYELQPFEDPRQSLTSYSSRTQAAQYNNPEHVMYLQQNARPPVSDSLRSQWAPQFPFPPPERSQLRTAPSNTQLSTTHVGKPRSPEPQLYHTQFYQPTSAPRQSQQSTVPPPLQYQQYQQQDSETPRLLASAPIVVDSQPRFMQPRQPPPPHSPPPPPTQLPPPPPFPMPPAMRTNTNSTQNSSTHSVALSQPTPPSRYETPSASLINGSSLLLPSLTGGPLNLPTEKATLGFCKGAVRFQSTQEKDQKKAFTLASRPAGVTGMIQHWRCKDCQFEGPLHTVVPPGKKSKPERGFDPKIRVSGENGVRYRWAFLAKCHVSCRIVPEGVRDGSFGTFLCVFCVLEGERRGWVNNNAGGVAGGKGTDGVSVFSNSSGASSKGLGNVASGPVFGNVASFMDHLGMHRKLGWWPGEEVGARFGVVMGRVAEQGEGFGVNLTPV